MTIKTNCTKYKGYLIFKRSYGYEIIKDQQVINVFNLLRECKTHIDFITQ